MLELFCIGLLLLVFLLIGLTFITLVIAYASELPYNDPFNEQDENVNKNS